ncbi:hypothetical protein K1719_004206 [Acacia pycnantha]|nr:hypothetical protein K1719_004206 [Acacia pycnantha]
MSAPLLNAAAVAVVAPAANHCLQELRSGDERSSSRANLHKDLNDALGWLLASQKDKDREALSGRQNDTSHVYNHWTNRVSNIETRVNSLNDKYEVRKKMLPHPNLKKKIKEALKEVNELRKNCPEKILVDYDELPERVIQEGGVKSIKKYLTLHKAFKGIQNRLEDEQVKCVLLHGQIGVGKTTIMKHLNNYHFYDSSDEKKFDMVIFIKAAIDEQADEHAEFLHILQKIADRIKEGREGDESEVAKRIRRVLKNRRYLLILDGIRYKPNRIWEMLDIAKDKKDSKVVITTRCHNLLKTTCAHKSVKLKPLNPNEAWIMFRDIVGDDHLSSEDIPKARLVCKRFCCCLPLLIYHIASSFELMVHQDWQMALNDFTPWPIVRVEGLAQLYGHLKTSYDLLGPSEQNCFLYASLYPANSNIYTHYLVECCIVQGFLSDVKADTGYNILRSRVSTILSHLISVSFLEQGARMRYVRVNYFYWQLASYIKSTDSNSEGRTNVDDEKHEEECSIRQDSGQHAKWFSRIGPKSNDLPTNQNCGSLDYCYKGI